MKRELIKTEAYLTVEAVLVMPMVLGVMLLTIYLLFFQYDRCLMEHNAGVLALRGCTYQITDREKLVQQIAEQSKQTDERYLAWNMEAARVSLRGNRFQVEQKGMLRFPFRGLVFWRNDKEWEVYVVYENYRIQPVEFIRNCRKIMGGK